MPLPAALAGAVLFGWPAHGVSPDLPANPFGRGVAGWLVYHECASDGTTTFLPSKDRAPVMIHQPKSYRTRRQPALSLR
jgi:hypothetical protein